MPDSASVATGPKLGQIVYADIGANFPNSLRALLRMVDGLLYANIISRTTTAPPGSPADGDAYIIPASATGAWAGKAVGTLAIWSANAATVDTNTKVPAWDFFAPKTGFLVYSQADTALLLYSAGAWAVFSSGGGGGSGTLAGDTDVAISSPSAGQVLTYDTGTSKWKNAASLGGPFVVASAPDAPPASPTSLDDEFNGSLLDPKWTLTTGGTSPVSPTEANGRLQFASGVHTGCSVYIKQAATLTTPYEFTAKLHYDEINATGNPSAMIWVGDGTKKVTFNYGFISSAWKYEVDQVTGFAFTSNAASLSSPWGSTAGAQNVPVQYLRLRDDGTNIILSASLDGFVFTQIASVGRLAWLGSTANECGLAVWNNGGCSFDWFRRTDGGYTPATPPAPVYVVAGAPDAPPLLPTSLDDEFSGTSLNPKWTRQQTGAITDTYANGRLLVTAITGGALALTQNAPGVTNQEFTCKLTIDQDNTTSTGNNPAAGIYFGDGTKIQAFVFGFINTVWQFQLMDLSAFGTYVSSPVTLNNPWGGGWMQTLYMRIKDDGTNIIVSASPDGFNFRQIGSVARLSYLASVTKVGLYVFGATGGLGGFTYDWFRRTDGGYTPAPPSGSAITASCAIAYFGLPSTLALNTEGSLDWLLFGNNTTIPDLQANFGSGTTGSGTYRKGLGGLQIHGLAPVGASAFSAGGAFPTVTFSFPAGESTNAAAQSFAVSALNFITGANNAGIRFVVPCDTFTRVLRIYLSNGDPYIVKCVSSDGTISTTSTRSTGGANNDRLAITYNGVRDGGQMVVYIGNDSSHTGNVCAAAITLGLA